jgi:hypothetical protein
MAVRSPRVHKCYNCCKGQQRIPRGGPRPGQAAGSDRGSGASQVRPEEEPPNQRCPALPAHLVELATSVGGIIHMGTQRAHNMRFKQSYPNSKAMQRPIVHKCYFCCRGEQQIPQSWAGQLDRIAGLVPPQSVQRRNLPIQAVPTLPADPATSVDHLLASCNHDNIDRLPKDRNRAIERVSP